MGDSMQKKFQNFFITKKRKVDGKLDRMGMELGRKIFRSFLVLNIKEKSIK